MSFQYNHSFYKTRVQFIERLLLSELVCLFKRFCWKGRGMQRRVREKKRPGREKRRAGAQGNWTLMLAAAAILLVLALATLAYVSMQKPAAQTPFVKPVGLNATETGEPPCFYTRSGHNVSCERLEMRSEER